eukprot:g30519.t1
MELRQAEGWARVLSWAEGLPRHAADAADVADVPRVLNWQAHALDHKIDAWLAEINIFDPQFPGNFRTTFFTDKRLKELEEGTAKEHEFKVLVQRSVTLLSALKYCTVSIMVLESLKNFAVLGGAGWPLKRWPVGWW